MERLRILLSNEWVGKKFVYVSKYGSETIGEIGKVNVGMEMSFDKRAAAIIKEVVDKKSKDNPTMRNIHEMIEIDKSKESKVFEWIGTRPRISIVSTKGQSYDLSEIYILNE